MAELFTGGCACGAIRYQCTSAPRYMGNCHCRDCQRATGSAYFPAMLMRAQDFELTSGEPSWYESQADAGHTMKRGFCANCGSPLFLINSARDGTMALYAGNLDDPSQYTPSRDIYVVSAQPWDIMHGQLPKHDGMP